MTPTNRIPPLCLALLLSTACAPGGGGGDGSSSSGSAGGSSSSGGAATSSTGGTGSSGTVATSSTPASSAAGTSGTATSALATSRGSSAAAGSGGSASGGAGVPHPTATQCQAFCTGVLASCLDVPSSGIQNEQWATSEQCNAACQAMPLGNVADTGGNTFHCRSYHLSLASTSPASATSHCVHTGPSPGGMCGSACEHYCDVVLAACTGGDAVFADRAACTTACSGLGSGGTAGDTTGNNVQCRTYYATLALAGNAGTRTLRCPDAAVTSTPCR